MVEFKMAAIIMFKGINVCILRVKGSKSYFLCGIV